MLDDVSNTEGHLLSESLISKNDSNDNRYVNQESHVDREIGLPESAALKHAVKRIATAAASSSKSALASRASRRGPQPLGFEDAHGITRRAANLLGRADSSELTVLQLKR